MPPDELNSIGVLKRREIEARILAPLLAAFGEEFGRERTFEIARRVIIQIAESQGAHLVESQSGNSLGDFAATLAAWQRDDAMQMDVLEQNDERFAFNVTRCRYAEMYRALGVPELGAMLSCNRDAALISGFSDTIQLTRTQTLMQGASHCDFRYVQLQSKPEQNHENRTTTHSCD